MPARFVTRVLFAVGLAVAGSGPASGQYTPPVVVRPVTVPPPNVPNIPPPKLPTPQPIYVAPAPQPKVAETIGLAWLYFAVPLGLLLVSGVFFANMILSALGRLFHRLKAPVDPVAAAYDDPWVQREMERRRAAGPSQPQTDVTPPG